MRQAHTHAWRIIARAGISDRLRQRRFIVLLLLAWAPFVVRALQIYVASTFAQASFLTPGPATFREFLDQQGMFVLFVTIFSGAGLIASDRRSHALQLYFSKPLTRTSYIMGKAATVTVFLLAITWAPAMLLLIVQTAFAANASVLVQNSFLIPAISVFSLLQAIVSSLVILALSSLSKNSRWVAVMYAGVVFFAAGVAGILRDITGNAAWDSLAPLKALDVIGDVLFQRTEVAPGRVLAAVLSIATLTAVSCWILYRRVQGSEVVS